MRNPVKISCTVLINFLKHNLRVSGKIIECQSKWRRQGVTRQGEYINLLKNVLFVYILIKFGWIFSATL